MQNITLQTSDSDLTTNEVLGRLAFAASNDSSGSDAILVAASIYAQAESEFTVSSNATSIVFATASSESATDKLKITSEGHLIPFTSGEYDLGSPSYPFRDLYVTSEVTSPSGNFDYIFFDTTIGDEDLVQGQMNWNSEAGTVELGLTNDVKIQLGQTVLFRVKNSTGSSLSKGQAVYASGVLGGGQVIQAAPFIADGGTDEFRFIGLMTDDLANGADGYVNHFGHIKNADLRTSNTVLNPNGETWAVGDILYVDDGTAGGLTKNPPQNDIYVALVLADGQNGELFVRITDPGHITDLHDVNLSGLVDNNLMVWNSGANYWESASSLYYVDGNVGIGIAAPSGALHVVGEAYVDNLKLDGNTLSSTNSNGNIYITPNGTGGIAGGTNSTVSGPYNIVAGGKSNVSSGSRSTVSGGQNNGATNTYSTVSGGYTNSATGCTSTVGGGRQNTASGACSTVAGGKLNTSSAQYGFIGGGDNNQVYGADSLVVGGSANVACNTFTAIVGGANNSACYGSFIGGGYGNTSSSWYATIGGGCSNTASASYSIVAGGRQNIASGACSTVNGGYSNTASGQRSTIGGGRTNTASNVDSVVGGGQSNCAAGVSSTIAGGLINTVNGNYSTIAGGWCNCVTGNRASILGGNNNTASGVYSAILGGSYNNDGGNTSVFILGTGITATSANTTYTQKLNVSHTTEPSGTLFNVEGSNGSLFSVVDNLSGVLMSVNNNAGLPVFEVYDDDSIIAGRFAQNDFVISSGGDVGIGTATPSYTLDVTGSGRFTSSLNVGSNIYLDSNDAYIFGSNNSNNIRFYDTADLIIFSTVTGGAARFDTDIILQKSPSSPIYGPSKSFTFVDYFSSTYDGYSQVIRTYQPIVLESAAPIISRADIEMRIDSNNDSTTNKFFITKDAGTEIFRIQENGNVGIGTTSPSYKLHVAGDISANANNIYGGGFAIYGDANNKLTKSGNDFTLSAGQTTTDIHLGYYDGGVLNKVVTVDSSADRVGILNTAPAHTLDVTGSGRFTSDLYAGGNLGVGTTSPSSELHVMGGGRFQGTSTNTTWTSASPNIAIKQSNNAPYISWHNDAGDRIGYLQMNSAGTNALVVQAAQPLLFRTNNQDRLFIAAAGNVGIGTTNPQYKLDVNGDSNLGGDVIVGGNLTVNGTTISTNVDTIEIQDPIITLGLTSGNIVTNDSYDRGVAMVTNDGTAFMGWDNSADKFVMLSSGVATNGSGNYDPGTWGQLDTGANVIHQATNGDTNGGLVIKSASDAFTHKLYATSAGYHLQLDTNGSFDVNVPNAASRYFYVSSDGNKSWQIGRDGIRNLTAGTNSGAGIYSRYDGYLGFNGLGTTVDHNAISLHQRTGHYDWGLALHYHGSGIGVPHTKGLVLDNRGRVGINDETPSYQLDVNGTAQILPTSSSPAIIVGRVAGSASIRSTTNTALILDSNGEPTYINHYVNEDIIMANGGGNVGIGTISPSEKLHVAGDVQIDGGGGTIGGVTFNNGLLKIGTSSNGISIDTNEIYGATDLYLGSLNPSHAIIFRHGTTERMRVASGGNVGIGTASPSEKLRVYGDVDSNLTIKAVNPNTGTSAHGVVRAESHNAGVGIFGYADNYSGSRYGLSTGGMSEVMALGSPSGLLIGTAANDVPIVFGNDNTERMRIAAGGNVGIGTVSPDAKLEISSTAIASGDARYELLITEDNTASAGRGGGLAFSRQGVIYGGIKTLQNTSSDSNTSMYFQTRGAGVVSNRMTIDEVGNVGIGTTSPSASDSNAKTLQVGNNLIIQNVVGTQTLFSHNAFYDGSWKRATTDDAGAIRFGHLAGGISFHLAPSAAAGSTITNWDNSDVKMVITSAGNVGIGTASPSAPLTVSSTANNKLTLTGGSSQNGLFFDNVSTGSEFYLYSLSNGFEIWDNTNSASRIRVANDGDIGIGTQSPSQKLDIRYPTGGGMALLKSTDTNDGLLFGDMALSSNTGMQGMSHAAMTGTSDYMIVSDGASTWVGAKSGGNTYIRSGGNNSNSQILLSSTEIVVNDNSSSLDFRVESNNNANMLFVDGVSDRVGIGTASPSEKLHVMGGTRIQGDSTNTTWTSPSPTLSIKRANDHPYISYHNNAGTRIGYLQFSSSQDASLNVDSNYGLRLRTNNSDSVYISNDGKMGIGTMSPTTQLDVVGSGNFSGDVTITGHLSAATKSFLINHPTREGHKLQYGSLESPYHGVRLTGRARVENGWCVVKLPEYISELVRNDNNINIQITNIKHGKVLYVDDTNIANNEFTVKTNSWFNRSGLEFFWTFTAVRKDVQELQVEF